ASRQMTAASLEARALCLREPPRESRSAGRRAGGGLVSAPADEARPRCPDEAKVSQPPQRIRPRADPRPDVAGVAPGLLWRSIDALECLRGEAGHGWEVERENDGGDASRRATSRDHARCSETARPDLPIGLRLSRCGGHVAGVDDRVSGSLSES